MMENGAGYKGRGGGAAVSMGGGVAGGGMEDRRNTHQQRYGSRPQYGYDKIKERVNAELSGPQIDLPPLDIAEKKFNANSRLFVGNLPRDIPYEELKSTFSKFGELGQVYFNKDGAYAFINFDYRANAEKAKRELQGTEVRNRPLKIRYASITTGVRVKNLTACVSNELLEKAFNVFGQIESCRVIVDDRGKPTGEGIVIFADKKGATLAVKKCHEECYFLTSALRPVIVDPLEARDEEEGNPESSMHKNDQYKQERKEGPRFADKNSFEYEYGIRWKRLYEMYKEKKMLLESDLQAEIDQLERRLAIVKHEHETEKLRQELMLREQEAAQMGRNMYLRSGGSSGYSSGYSSLGGGYSSSSGHGSSYSSQGTGYNSSSSGGGYGSQGGSYGGSDRYSGMRGDRYSSEYDVRRDDRYPEDRYNRMQDERYMLQDDRYKGSMRNNYPQGGPGGMPGGPAGTGSPAPNTSGVGGAVASPGALKGPGPNPGLGLMGEQPFPQGGMKRDPSAAAAGGPFQPQRPDQAADLKRDNMPGGRDSMPAGRDNMPAGRDSMPGGRDNMPGGRDMPAGRGNMPAGRDNMPGGRDNMPAGRDNLPGGRDNMPAGRDNMPAGRDNMPGGRDNMPGGRDNMPGGRDNMPGGGQQFPQGGSMKRDNMPGGNQQFPQGGGMKRDNVPGGNQQFPQGGMKQDNIPGAGQQFPQGGMKRDNMPGGGQQFPQGGMNRNNMPGGGGQQFPQGGIGGMKRDNMPGGGQQFPQGGMGMKRDNMPAGGQQFNQGGIKPGGGPQFPQGGGMKRDNIAGVGIGQFPQGGMKRDAIAAGGMPQQGAAGLADIKRARY